MKKLINFFKSSKSDFFLFIIFLILLNLVLSNSYFRIDLTSPKSYSLSQSSIETVKTLEQPLSIKVFFTKNLPSPYSSIEQYIKDILVEYKNKGNEYFSCEFFDMNKEENQQIARNFGLSQVQIQEIKNNEIGFKQVWMGLAVSYADRTELIDGLDSADGLEYRLTTTMKKLISTTSSLAGLKGKVNLKLYVTEKLSSFKIAGFDILEKTVKEAYKTVNKENMNRIHFEKIDPSQEDIAEISEKYGLQTLSWNSKELGKGVGILGLVLEHEDNFRIIPLQINRSFFGQNMISGLDTLQTEITENLKSLISKSEILGYITGHEELDLNDTNYGAGLFNNLVSDHYKFQSLNLKDEHIPSSIKTIVINGPKSKFEDSELYKIDQFLMKGGNIVILADSFKENIPQGEAAYYQMPTYTPIESGLDKLLSKYGISIEKNYVLDENCYVNKDNRTGSTPYYFAPLLQKSNFDKKNVIVKNLGYVCMFLNSSIDVSEAETSDSCNVTILAKSSPKSWLMKDRIMPFPQFISVPTDKSVQKSENLAILVEGKFESAYDKNIEESSSEKSPISISSHLEKSIQNGKIFVTGSSRLTTAQLIDNTGRQPVAIFLRNTIDYMNGETDLCLMRTKGLSLNTLKLNSGISVTIAKYFNQIGLVVFIILGGIISYINIKTKKNKIKQKYNPNDEREIQ
ncbi:MAG: Gldg family protein [Treponema sp.]|nr:Gldg family protein [Treponema sp.]MBP3607517.1 Gldg family protein [Treponema sp.]